MTTELWTAPQRFNMADYFLDERIREGLGERIAVCVGEQQWTYDDVQARCNQAANALSQAGIGAEDRVLLLLPDGIAFVDAFFGSLKTGAVFCMGNPLATADDMNYLLDYTRARAVVAHESTLDRLQDVIEKHPRCHARFFVSDGAPAPEGWHDWEQSLGKQSHDFKNCDTSRDDVAGWLFTSGTTGKPKGAVHFHHDFPWNTEHYAKATLGLKQDDVFVSVSRLFFGYATGTNLMFPFAVGGTAVLFPQKPTPDVLFDHIEKHKVTVLTNVPAMIRQMVDSERQADLSSVRICLSAGEALPAELYERWKKRWPNAEILDGIGSAEMFHIYVSNRLGDVKLGSLGRIVPGYETRIVGADGADVADGEVGRLWIKGDSSALCYWGDQKKSHDVFRGEWTVSADMFRKDEDGYYYYAGRADDLLKVRGMFVSPLEIEDCLATHPDVKECAVVGVPDDEGLTIPKAFVVLRTKQGNDQLASVLQEYVRTRLTKYKFPRRVVFVDELPRNDRGKIIRKALEQDHGT